MSIRYVAPIGQIIIRVVVMKASCTAARPGLLCHVFVVDQVSVACEDGLAFEDVHELLLHVGSVANPDERAFFPHEREVADPSPRNPKIFCAQADGMAVVGLLEWNLQMVVKIELA